MWMLFEVGLFFGAMIRREKEKAEEESETSTEVETTEHNDQPPSAQP